MFKALPEQAPRVSVSIEGRTVRVPAHWSVAAAVLAQELDSTRESPVSGAARAPYCLMGVCFECLMEIDGEPNQQACLRRVRAGMVIKRQRGAPRVPE